MKIESNSFDVASDVDASIESLQDKMDKELDRTTKEAVSIAKREAPVQTGHLRDSTEGDLQNHVLFNTADYHEFVCLGTVYMEPNNFLRRGAKKAFKNSIQRIKRWQ
jgi:dihydrodipicolinate synthase/N-acetylneuraminate lyase